MSVVEHAPFAPRRGATVKSWWATSLARAVEESAFEEADLKRGRTLARQGAVGALTLAPGQVHAAVTERGDQVVTTARLPLLDDESVTALVEVVASVSGWISSLMRSDLPRDLVEASEEMGVELLPWGGEFDCSCTCEAWADPCVHALALLTQMTWWADVDPLVLTAWRGLGREALLVRLGEYDAGSAPQSDVMSAPDEGLASTEGAGGDLFGGDDLDVAVEAAERALVILGDAEAS